MPLHTQSNAAVIFSAATVVFKLVYNFLLVHFLSSLHKCCFLPFSTTLPRFLWKTLHFAVSHGYFYLALQPYLSSTRSLSPMSGLFGSIWAPQSDIYESCCPVSAATQHSTHVENQAVMCKQEYYPRFNPFRAYMNLDIWTTAANRNANFPLSRDSGYCGNV